MDLHQVEGQAALGLVKQMSEAVEFGEAIVVAQKQQLS